MDFILSLPKELAVMIVGALPIFELRGAIPLGFYLDLPLYKIFIFAVIGNLIPVIPILLFLEPVSEKLRHFSFLGKFFDWFFARTKKKADLVQKYEALGLMLFVCVPLPVTGAWTGAVAASLFKIRFKYAFLAILMGVILAGIIVTSLCVIGKMTWRFAL